MKQIISSLDIGSNSIKLIVAEMYEDKLFVLACSEIKSKGIKKGLIVDSEKVLESLKEAFKRAEDVLGIKIDKVIMTVPSYYAEFKVSEGYTTITREDKTINGQDITNALQASIYGNVSSNLELVNVTPVDFIINESEITKDPKGKEAYKLSVNSLLGTVPKKNVYTLLNILETIGIKVIDFSFGGQADYEELKKQNDDKTLGAVINIGSNKTEVSIINEGVLVSTEVLETGGKNIDRDISYIYDLTLEDSKKLKEKFAFAHKNGASTSEIAECLTKTGEHIKINQYEISEIVYSRLREILEISKKQINLLTKKDISYIIITGGTTEIDGFNKVYNEIFGKNKELSKVEELGVRNNKFSTCLGSIRLYYEKLKFRDIKATTIMSEEQEELFKEKKKIDNSLLGKVYSYFFDN